MNDAAARTRAIDRLGMMVFLASETMLFGALFGAAFAMFVRHPKEVAAASTRLDLWLGGANTMILLTSSLLVAIGVEAGRRTAARCLGGAAALGLVFLGIKGWEWRQDWADGLMPGTAAAHFDGPAHELFMNLYFIATGLHGLHVAAGIVLLGILARRMTRGTPPSPATLENAGLYWHLVDVVWVFLYPVLYLTRG